MIELYLYFTRQYLVLFLLHCFFLAKTGIKNNIYISCMYVITREITNRIRVFPKIKL